MAKNSMAFFNLGSFLFVVLCWFMFAGSFVFNRRRPAQALTPAPERTRDARSRLGIYLQAASYAVVWGFSRSFRPLVRSRPALNVALLLLAAVLALGAVWLVAAAVRTLGREWSLTARLVEGHRLVTQGPYALVRHPIYTGMFGLLLATGLTYTTWPGLLGAVVVFWVGTVIRVRSEERLLRAAFGAEFETYARRVRAVLPGLY